MRQCQRCGAVLPPERHSPLCLPCWTNHQRERRRDNVRAFRQRAREQAQPADDGRPNGDDFAWLDELGLGLVEPLVALEDLYDAGRGPPDSEWVRLGNEALRLYYGNRDEFERRAVLRPDPEGRAEAWRGFFEELRSR